MIKLICEKLPRITKNRKKLEKALDLKITNRGKEVYLEGDAESEYNGEKVIEALDFGFPFEIALLLKNSENIFEIVSIKENTTRKDFPRIRGRIIGKDGKTLKTLSNLTDCNLEIKDNFIGVIGDAERMQTAQEAIRLLIQGSKQGNVYAYLEKHQPKPIIDLGLKKNSKK